MVWRFEAWTPEERQVAYKSQVNLFWAGLLAQQALWTILFLSAMFSLKLAGHRIHRVRPKRLKLIWVWKGFGKKS